MVGGTAGHDEQYCGGAAPSPEILRSLQRPLGCAEFVVRAGSANLVSAPIVARFATQADGKFSVALAPGVYCVTAKGTPAAAVSDGPSGPDFLDGVRGDCGAPPPSACAAVWTVDATTRPSGFGLSRRGAPCAWECMGGPVPN